MMIGCKHVCAIVQVTATTTSSIIIISIITTTRIAPAALHGQATTRRQPFSPPTREGRNGKVLHSRNTECD